jgi:hypothetical protein
MLTLDQTDTVIYEKNEAATTETVLPVPYTPQQSSPMPDPVPRSLDLAILPPPIDDSTVGEGDPEEDNSVEIESDNEVLAKRLVKRGLKMRRGAVDMFFSLRYTGNALARKKHQYSFPTSNSLHTVIQMKFLKADIPFQFVRLFGPYSIFMYAYRTSREGKPNNSHLFIAPSGLECVA